MSGRRPVISTCCPAGLSTASNRAKAGPAFGKLGAWCSASGPLAYALGLTVCGALTAGLFFSPTMEQPAGAGESAPENLWADASPGDSAAQDTALSESRWLGSTNPVTAAQTADTFFPASEARAIPVSLFESN